MKSVWTLYGAVVLTALVAGCANQRQQGPSEEEALSALQESHVEAAQSASGLADLQSELVRDLRHLYAGTPENNIHQELLENSERFAQRVSELRRDIQVQVSEEPAPEPVLPEYNPLDDIRVSLEMDREDVRHIFQALAKMTNMNLLIHPDIVENPPIISVSFQNIEASTVFRELLDLADLYGRIEGNLLRVDPFQETTIRVDFLETQTTGTYAAGGDVLGDTGGENTESGGLTGDFSLSGTTPENNPYTQLEGLLENNVGEDGAYSLNRMSGILHVRARPSAIRRVTQLVEAFKAVVTRQILIETRIMEVQLTDQYRTGIDWAMLRQNFLVSAGISQTLTPSATAIPLSDATLTGAASLSSLASATSTSLGLAGLTLGYATNNFLMSVDLLKQFGDVQTLSNPTIRARHGQPAMISVGKSTAYIRQTDVTTTGSGTTATTSVATEVDSVFDGLVIGIVPFITSEGRITLAVHPVKSDVDVSNTTVVFSTTITLPQVDLKEMSTVLEVGNQDTVLLGGLIDSSRAAYRTGVPILSEIPVLGRFFTNSQELETNRELVIMLKATIL